MTTVNPIHYTSSQTNDSDLVELAGAHSYAHYDINEVFKVNGKKFRVLDTVYETDSGLDALTVQNIDSKELSVVFVGSEQMDKDWLGTNTKLLGNVPPVQVKEAVAYFNKVNEKIIKTMNI